MKKIGQILIEEGYISQEDVDEALILQEGCRSRLGDVLMASGKIKAYNYYQGLAKYFSMEFVDLLKNKPDDLFLEEEERHNYIKLKTVPWHMEEGVMVLATCDPSEELTAWAADKYKEYRLVVTSIFDIYWVVDHYFRAANTKEAIDLLWEKNPAFSARNLFIDKGFITSVILTLSLMVMIIFHKIVIIPLFIAINIFYLVTLFFKIKFFLAGWISNKQRKSSDEYLKLDARTLPTYTILVPMYKEKKATISGLIEAIRQLNYPHARLDVKLIIENDDEDTLHAAQGLNLESYFHIVHVPVSYPRTKPKACNYALQFARGKYITIYDSEDRPEPNQLRKVITKFRQSKDNVTCVQCKLNYYNRNENMLTKLFSLEYSSWFNFMIPGLEILKVPVPLGGTSNHFLTQALKGLYAWDPYNVTEDADLGLRISQEGGKTAIVDSLTLEEAPISFVAWVKQRSRWLKGYMQTYIVHMRKPKELYKKLGARGFFGFMFFMGAPAIVFFTIPFVAVISCLSLIYPLVFPDWFVNIAVTNFIAGIVTHIAIALIVIAHHQWWGLLFQSLIFPFYWLLHIISSFKGLYELLFHPHYWDKTEHGVSKVKFSNG